MPWEPRATSPKVGWLDAWFLSLFDRFARAVVKQGCLRLILPTGEERCYGANLDVQSLCLERHRRHATLLKRLADHKSSSRAHHEAPSITAYSPCRGAVLLTPCAQVSQAYRSESCSM